MRNQYFTILVCIGLGACVSTPEQAEIKTGAFLDKDERPDFIALLPPPPAEGSPAAAADREASAEFLELMNSPRWQVAILDAAFRAPGGAAVFSCAAETEALEGNS